ncbi:MAG: VWA domain-containing protein [Pyrinomonadaceae bacterium]
MSRSPLSKRNNLKFSTYALLVCALLALICAGDLVTPRSRAQQQQTQATRPRRTEPGPKGSAFVPALAPSPTPAPPVKSPTPQPSTPAEEIEPDEVIRVSTSEVLLPVTVRDAEGRLVKSLGREDFRVFENGREQPLSGLELRQAPVDVALMIDSSSSVAASFEDFRRAAEEFAGGLAADDRVCLLKFDDKVELLQDWTNSRLQLRRALRRLTPGMFTHFNDALYLAAREQFKGQQRRHAVVVLSDGIDSGRGFATIEKALAVLLESAATVYVIANTEIQRAAKRQELDTLLNGPPSNVRFNELRIGDLREGLRVLDLSERNLEQLTAATGGRLYRPQSFEGLGQVYAEVAEELRSQYAIYYTPLDKGRDGKFRRVEVQTNAPTHRIATRIGYFAPRG